MLQTTMSRTFGDALRAAREEAGLNQVDLALRMKLSAKSGQSNVAALENRQFPPKRQTVLRVAAAIPIDVYDLLDDVITPWGLPMRKDAPARPTRARDPAPGPTTARSKRASSTS